MCWPQKLKTHAKHAHGCLLDSGAGDSPRRTHKPFFQVIQGFPQGPRRYNRQQDLLTGIPIQGRSTEQNNSLGGCNAVSFAAGYKFTNGMTPLLCMWNAMLRGLQEDVMQKLWLRGGDLYKGCNRFIVGFRNARETITRQ